MTLLDSTVVYSLCELEIYGSVVTARQFRDLLVATGRLTSDLGVTVDYSVWEPRFFAGVVLMSSSTPVLDVSFYAYGVPCKGKEGCERE